MTSEEQPRFWEPWQPQVGDRVQGRVSAECPANHWTPPGKTVYGIITGYSTAEDGHNWLIQLDGWPISFPAAAIELVKL